MTVQATLDGTITEPGVYDIPAEVYHADPVPDGSLSSSGARRLLPPSCPAKFRYEQDHPAAPTPEMTLGTAAHRLLLGAGPDIVTIDAKNWKTKAAQDERDAAHDAGQVPLLRAQHDQVQAMVRALRAHRVANALFNPLGTGRPERSLFWVDRPTGVWRRARLDWLPEPGTGRMIIADYKTTCEADPDSLERAILRYGYHMQAAWYLAGVRALGVADDVAFVFVFQEKTPPYVVTVVELSALTLRIGADQNRQAIEIYRQCRDIGHWPGYSDDIVYLGLPPWAENRHLEDMR